MMVAGAAAATLACVLVDRAIAVGKQPPSPSPARNLNRPKTHSEGAQAHRAVNIEKLATA